MLIIGTEKEMRSGIDRIQAKFPLKKHELMTEVENLRAELCQKGEIITSLELKDGGTYGMMTLSQKATAFTPTRKELSNHGDVYISVWKWDASHRQFVAETAWGGEAIIPVARALLPLVSIVPADGAEDA